jgi:hypothetical protein
MHVHVSAYNARYLYDGKIRWIKILGIRKINTPGLMQKLNIAV